jgi:hypothetical protein
MLFFSLFAPPRRGLLLVLLLACLARGGLLLAWHERLRADPDAYRLFAQTLVETGVYAPGHTPGEAPEASAHRPPLYPLLLAACLKSPAGFVPTVAALHWALGVGTVAIVLALAASLPRAWAPLAGVLVALDPLLLNQSALVMTETLAAFLTALALLALDRARRKPTLAPWAFAGMVLALAALCRPTYLIALAAVAGVLALREIGNFQLLIFNFPSPRSPARVLAFVLGSALVLLPWVVRNQIALGGPIIATTHGGYTLHLANNPAFYAYLRDGDWGERWRLPPDVEPGEYLSARLRERDLLPPADAPRRELAIDRAHYAAAWRTIREEPGTFLWSCVVRLGRFWQLVPHRLDADESPARRGMRYAVGLWYLGEFLLAAFGLWRLRRHLGQSPWLWGLTLIASFALLHAFYWTNMRMRAPLVPVVALFAAAGAPFIIANRK